MLDLLEGIDDQVAPAVAHAAAPAATAVAAPLSSAGAIDSPGDSLEPSGGDVVEEEGAEEAPSTPISLNLQWQATLAAIAQVEAAQAHLAATVRGFWQSDLPREGAFCRYKISEELRGVVRNMLIRHASASGGGVQVDTYALREAIPREQWACPKEIAQSDRRLWDRLWSEHRNPAGVDDYLNQRFNPDAIWAYLESTYAGDKGRELAHRQNAAAIWSEFYLERQPPVRRANGSLIIEKRVLMDSIFGNRYSSHYESSFMELASALQEFADWAEIEVLALHQTIRERFWSGGRNKEFQSRERFSCGEISFVTYKEKVVFEFSPTAADKLMEYIGLYGPSQEKED